MCWVKCHKCGEENLLPKKIKHGKKASIRCTNPECGATAPLKTRSNGNVRGLKHSFI